MQKSIKQIQQPFTEEDLTTVETEEAFLNIIHITHPDTYLSSMDSVRK